MRNNSAALKFAAAALRGKRDFILRCVRGDGSTLEYAVAELRADRETVLAAVSQCGDALRYAVPPLREDRELVLAAVNRGGRYITCVACIASRQRGGPSRCNQGGRAFSALCKIS